MKLTVERKVTVELTPAEWQIFSAELMVSEEGGLDLARAGVAACAAALNQAASKALSLEAYADAERAFNAVADQWMAYGASDTEPRAMFRSLARKVGFTDDEIGW